MDAVSMQTYIASMDKQTLPRILQVCSGVYFQGSVYEVSGNEVCLSTGDLVKVVGVELQSASVEDIDTKEVTELPLSYTGLFKMVLENMAYSSVEEMMSLAPVDLETGRAFSFTSRGRLELDSLVLESDMVFTLLSLEHSSKKGGKPSIHCKLLDHQGAQSEVFLPIACHGEFYEYDTGHTYSLHEILASPHLCTRRFHHAQAPELGGPFLLSPVYKVQAIMNMRRDIVNFPSSLEVDVVDVTEQARDTTFITPLTLEELASKAPATFPAMAEVLEGPGGALLFKAPWLKSLRKGQQLVVHECRESHMVLASTPQGKKARQHFLISQHYGGCMRLRPREFSMVFELCSALQCSPGLSVSVSRHCDALEDGLDSLSTGDQLEVLHSEMAEVRGVDGKTRPMEVLVCRCLPDDEDDEDEDSEEGGRKVRLPMYLEGHFVEKLKDKKKHRLANLLKSFSLPLDVKVVSRATGLHCDPLGDLPALQLKETLVEPVVVASLAEQPDQCFELPQRWVSLLLCITGDPLPWPEGQPPDMHYNTASEVTEDLYFELNKLTDKAHTAPPLPPKHPDNTVKVSHTTPPKPRKTAPRSRSDSLPEHMGKVNLNEMNLKKLPPPPLDISETKRLPPLPRKPGRSSSSAYSNTYVVTPKVHKAPKKKDHDYETLEDFIQSAQESVTFY